MKKNEEVLKTYFETGTRPTQKQFGDLIDSFHHKNSGVIIEGVQTDKEGNSKLGLSDGTTISITKTAVEIPTGGSKVISEENSPKPIAKIWSGTQFQYDQITTKQNDVLYFVEEDLG